MNRSTFGYLVLLAAVLVLFAGQYRNGRDLERQAERADKAICLNVSKSLTRQIILLKDRTSDYTVFAEDSRSPEIRAHFMARLPRHARQIKAAEAQLKKLGDCTITPKEEP